MDESQLKAFVAINRYGSFTAAADSLYITQPAISKRIAALESQLGTPLFDRIGRNARLTESGQQLLPLVEKMLLSFANLRQSADNMKQQVSGGLSLDPADTETSHRRHYPSESGRSARFWRGGQSCR